MALRNLKSIIGKKKIAYPILLHVINDALDADVWIEDEEENVLVGEKQNDLTSNIPVMSGIKVLGYVKGGGGVEIISELLQMLITKEEEKKMSKKTTGIVALIAGIVILGLSLLADRLGIGVAGFGSVQIAGVTPTIVSRTWSFV